MGLEKLEDACQILQILLFTNIVLAKPVSDVIFDPGLPICDLGWRGMDYSQATNPNTMWHVFTNYKYKINCYGNREGAMVIFY